MQVQSVELRDFRSHHRFQADLGGSLTVIAGPNGSGKTNILEGIHFGLTGRSCRTSMDRQVVAWDTDTTIASVNFSSNGVDHTLATALQRSGDKRVQLDGSAIETSVQIADRPTVVVFLPDKLSLVNGAPGERRIHMDRVIGAFTPRMPSLKADYNQALAQRNVLLASRRSSGSDHRAFQHGTRS
ncbi:MAG: AAA family ATPase [Solirubrobacterales bacterium]|nr:AAA family ATPase [Solirubrobacterales bacterium]